MVDETDAALLAMSWLTPAHAGAVAQVRLLARMLDEEPTAALAAAYGTAMRALLRGGERAEQGDDVDDMIAAARGG